MSGCACIYAAHCDPKRQDCALRHGGTINDGGGVCRTGGNERMTEHLTHDEWDYVRAALEHYEMTKEQSQAHLNWSRSIRRKIARIQLDSRYKQMPGNRAQRRSGA